MINPKVDLDGISKFYNAIDTVMELYDFPGIQELDPNYEFADYMEDYLEKVQAVSEDMDLAAWLGDIHPRHGMYDYVIKDIDEVKLRLGQIGVDVDDERANRILSYYTKYFT